MTHCERLLAVLSDGREHDHHELYALNMIVHSRVADLRRRGYVIEHRRDGELSLYRLVGSLDETQDGSQCGADGTCVSSSAPPSVGAAISPVAGGALPPSTEPAQLAIWEAA